MDNLKEAFEEVADWCEKHLEHQRGREIGMTFGAMLRAYGHLATPPADLNGEQRAARDRQRNARAEKLLMELSTRCLVAHGWVEKTKLAEPTFGRTNLTYDDFQRPKP